MLERLQKIIARAGIASRRHAEELIKSGLVTVNGETITELGSKADESKDHIKVQGKLLRPETERVYLLLNKPPEVVSTMIDPEGRRTLSDLLYGVSQRVFPVGRLEYHSMGLVFLTNDGELANLILKAHHLPQTYELKLKTLLTFDEIESLSRATGARIARIKGKDAPWYEVTLSEARRDALRNRLFQTGHPVEKIKRVKIGNLAMESLPTGNHRPLSDGEVVTLRRSLQAGTIQNVAATEASRHENPASRAPSVSAQSITQPLAAHAGKYLAHPARRPLVKRRPFQPRIKPGQAPSKFSQSNFSRHKPYSPEFNAQRPTATGSESLQRPFDRIAGPQNLSSDGPKRFKRPFEDSRGQSRPVASGSKPSKRTSFNSQRRATPTASVRAENIQAAIRRPARSIQAGGIRPLRFQHEKSRAAWSKVWRAVQIKPNASRARCLRTLPDKVPANGQRSKRKIGRAKTRRPGRLQTKTRTIHRSEGQKLRPRAA